MNRIIMAFDPYTHCTRTHTCTYSQHHYNIPACPEVPCSFQCMQGDSRTGLNMHCFISFTLIPTLSVFVDITGQYTLIHSRHLKTRHQPINSGSSLSLQPCCQHRGKAPLHHSVSPTEPLDPAVWHLQVNTKILPLGGNFMNVSEELFEIWRKKIIRRNFSCGTPLAVIMLSPWHSARCSSHQA